MSPVESDEEKQSQSTSSVQKFNHAPLNKNDKTEDILKKEVVLDASKAINMQQTTKKTKRRESLSSSDSENSDTEETKSNTSSSTNSLIEEKNTKSNTWDRIFKTPTYQTSPGSYKYVKKIVNEPERAKLWVEFAVYLLSIREFERAERYLKRAMFLDPTNATSFACYGLFLGKHLFF